MEKYNRLKDDYYSRFPNEVSEKPIEALAYSFGFDEAVRILEESNGRKIIVTDDDEAIDKIEYHFEAKL